jgi:hypothetical protein
MEWSGRFVVLDAMTKTPVGVHVTGVLDGDVEADGDPPFRTRLIEAVRAVAADHGGGALALSDAKDAIADIAGQRLGVPGRVSITAFSFDPGDMERLTVFAMRAAARGAGRRGPEHGQATEAPCPVCGSPGGHRFCPECGAPRAPGAYRT